MSGPEPGLEILPGLTLLRRLGRGGMGEAWLARDASSGAEVVAKLLPADAPPERLALLRREARLVRKLSHPGIVPVIGFRAGERFCAVTLAHMPGGDAQALRGAPPGEVARLGREVADALAYLHDMGVVHRDVKASNVLLDADGRARLADFGIASVAQEDEDGLVVRGGGSRASMSPQQRSGAAPTPADDLYALGVLLFELLGRQAARRRRRGRIHARAVDAADARAAARAGGVARGGLGRGATPLGGRRARRARRDREGGLGPRADRGAPGRAPAAAAPRGRAAGRRARALRRSA